MFVNVSDRYGEQEHVVLADYIELNPEGEFGMSLQDRDGVLIDVIIEKVGSEWEVIAEAV